MRQPAFREIRRVALYLRVSTTEQAQGHSLDSQRSALIAWANSEGWEISAVFEDAGASGTAVQGRAGFLKMISAAQAGGFDAILVLKVDRFARSTRDSAIYRELLNDCGVRLLSKTEPTVGDGTPAGFLTHGIFDVISEHYSVQLSHNVARGKRTRAEKGLPLGDIPFGYKAIDPKQPPEIVPDEADAVLRMFEHYAAGDKSMLELAERFNHAGYCPRSKRERTVFSKATIAGMLSNPLYVGDITYHGQIVGTGRHEPIIGRTLWEQVQRVRNERARRPQVFGARPTRVYMLAGVSVCSVCGSPLWANSTGGGRNCYYRCASRNRGDACADRTTGCRAEVPEGEVSGLFSHLELPNAWRNRVETLVRCDDDGRDVERERCRLEERIRRVKQGLIDGVLDNKTAKAAVREADAAIHTLPNKNGAPVQAGEALTDIRQLWPHMTAEERRDLVRLVLAKVEVDLRTGTIAGVIPKPAFAPLFRVLAEEEGGLISVCAWRPRSDSNRRSPP